MSNHRALVNYYARLVNKGYDEKNIPEELKAEVNTIAAKLREEKENVAEEEEVEEKE